jgi:hypothetical protein
VRARFHAIISRTKSRGPKAQIESATSASPLLRNNLEDKISRTKSRGPDRARDQCETVRTGADSVPPTQIYQRGLGQLRKRGDVTSGRKFTVLFVGFAKSAGFSIAASDGCSNDTRPTTTAPAERPTKAPTARTSHGGPDESIVRENDVRGTWGSLAKIRRRRRNLQPRSSSGGRPRHGGASSAACCRSRRARTGSSPLSTGSRNGSGSPRPADPERAEEAERYGPLVPLHSR